MRAPRSLVPLRLAFAALAAAVSLVAASSAQAQSRNFQRSFTANLPGRLLVTGNSAVRCDPTVTAIGLCNALENTPGLPTANNDVIATAWADVDADATTYNSSSGTLAFNGTVEWAGLYWWGNTKPGGTRTAPADQKLRVLFGAPAKPYAQVNAAWSVDGPTNGDPYLAFADVTALVRDGGAGDYTVANIVANTGIDDFLGGWTLLVVNRDMTLPLRHISIFDGYRAYGGAAGAVSTMLSGFLTPLQGALDAQVTFVSLDGDATRDDSLGFGGMLLSNALNPVNDTGNSTISANGVAIAARNPSFANTLGTDIDTFDVSSRLANGDTMASAEFAAVSAETNFAVLVAFQTTLYAPKISVTLEAVDANGGEVLPGDELVYTATVTNAADALDNAVRVVLTDVIPANTTFVPGSLQLIAAPSGGVGATGALTDAAGDDTGTFDMAGNRVAVNLGGGATSAAGGTLAPGQTVIARLRVKVAANLSMPTVISNQVAVAFEGQTLASTSTTVTFQVTSGGDVTATPPDTDGDGLRDPVEVTVGSDPNDADTDDDGVIDGQEPAFDQDSDGDGFKNVLDPDSDNEGLADGTELGKDCANPATNAARGRCVPDADPATTTDATKADTDNGSVRDGAEDANRNGKIDAGETNPNDPADDVTVKDMDGDGLSDEEEKVIGSNPNDADSDDDGLVDGQEPNPAIDQDGDGLINVLDPDSDDDGLFDGTELGKDCANAATNAAARRCVADADPATKTNPLVKDTDNGGVSDGSEDANLNGKVDAGERDPLNPADDMPGSKDTDMDGLSDDTETNVGSNPNDADSDDDGLPDGQEPNFADDTDGDGLPNVLDPDSDDDGLYDGTEAGKDCAGMGTNAAAGKCRADADPATKTSPIVKDTDKGGVSDGSEDANLNGKVDANERNPLDPADDMPGTMDSDMDGLSDATEVGVGSNPNDADSDDDGLPDGQEPNFADDTDGDGLPNVLDPDSDDDGLYDGTETGKPCNGAGTNAAAGHCRADADPATKTSPIVKDTDKGGVSDGSEDTNLDGKVDAGERDPLNPADDMPGTKDTDMDGLSDGTETTIGSNPNDADSDDDGLLDGEEPNPADDTDGDGLKNVLDPDSDNDALFDGTEAGKPCNRPGTNSAAGTCRADVDPATKTSPLVKDTDKGGVSDGSEDANLDGKVDQGERDPLNPADDVPDLRDADMDGLSDDTETTIGTNPNDADSDDDGLIDGQEPNPGVDSDGDGQKNALDPDSDNDGLYDGTEAGKDCGNPGTNVAAGKCRIDADMGATKTAVLDADTDDGGVTDGAEDVNKNGAKEAGEGDPLDPRDDRMLMVDTDGDGLSDDREVVLGSNPMDADSDDDGVIDGQEPNLDKDPDGDGKKNVVDPDSDNDGLFDGTELGLPCSNAATDATKGTCVADADPATKTNPELADTDRGGVPDGEEDVNKNGRVDAGERNPLNAADDNPNPGTGGAGGAGGTGGATPGFATGTVAGGGCDCHVGGRGGADAASWVVVLLFGALLIRPRRRR